jgi:hypothetical protein
MKKMLEKSSTRIWHFIDGVKYESVPSGVRGDLTGVYGDLDYCEITNADRARGIDIADLIK